MPPTIGTIPIGNLPASASGTAVAFRIPAYQRGYRWKSDDVRLLLKDLNEFLGETGQENCRPFYCLQPLVVTKSDKHDCWEVVDGQQRLTTLFLLWKYLNDQPPYDLSYDTRERSRDFLNAPKAEENGKKLPYIDFYHIYHAHQTIHAWFNNDEAKKEDFKNLLADTHDKGRNIRFIWYQLDPDDDAVEAFTRLNVGKIPLTNEELIRALFLRNPEGGELAEGAFQHRLALEWDRIETALQEPDFWGFISNQTPPEGGRIRLLFELTAPPDLKDDDRQLFVQYQDRLIGENAEAPSDVWKEIVNCFEQLEEWYRDPKLFHLVGFRTAILGKKSVETLRKLLNDARSSTKPTFANNLREEIREALINTGKTVRDFLAELDYKRNPQCVRKTLALFNIATILRTEGVQVRFPFHLYHDTKVGWDIEHIQSLAGDELGDRPRQLVWLESCKPELEHESKLQSIDDQGDKSGEVSLSTLIAEIERFGKPASKQDFPDLEKRIRAYFCENEADEKEINSIGNLTLLDAPTNRGYGNAPFVVKRTEILKQERPKGTFILPCTRDLFLKVFSVNAGNLRRWDIEKDGAAHKEAICKTLKTFFGEKEEESS